MSHWPGRGARVSDKGLTSMAKGTVKWFNTEKGYGFIQPADGGKDIFVHITAVQAAGLQSLKDNQPIEYELIDGRDGRKSAGALKSELSAATAAAACPAGAGRRLRLRAAELVAHHLRRGPPRPGPARVRRAGTGRRRCGSAG